VPREAALEISVTTFLTTCPGQTLASDALSRLPRLCRLLFDFAEIRNLLMLNVSPWIPKYCSMDIHIHVDVLEDGAFNLTAAGWYADLSYQVESCSKERTMKKLQHRTLSLFSVLPRNCFCRIRRRTPIRHLQGGSKRAKPKPANTAEKSGCKPSRPSLKAPPVSPFGSRATFSSEGRAAQGPPRDRQIDEAARRAAGGQPRAAEASTQRRRSCKYHRRI